MQPQDLKAKVLVAIWDFHDALRLKSFCLLFLYGVFELVVAVSAWCFAQALKCLRAEFVFMRALID